jgi:heat shock protein HtpX
MRAVGVSIVLVAALLAALVGPEPARAELWGCHVGRTLAGFQEFSERRFDGVQATITVTEPIVGLGGGKELVAGVVGIGDTSNYVSGAFAARRNGNHVVPVIEWAVTGTGRVSQQLRHVAFRVGTPHMIRVQRDRAPSPRAGGRRWRVVFDDRYVNWLPLAPADVGPSQPYVFMAVFNSDTPCDSGTAMRFTNVRVRAVGSNRWVPFSPEAESGASNQAYEVYVSGPTSFLARAEFVVPPPWLRVYLIAVAIALAVALVLVFMWTRYSYVRDLALSMRMLGAVFLLILLYLPLFALPVAFVYGRTSSFASAVVACLVEICLAFSVPYFSDRLVLAGASARIVSRGDAPELHACVERLCGLANLRKPRIALASSDIPSAFATGAGTQATIVLSEALLERLDAQELGAVVAHELAHIANGDAFVLTVLNLVPALTGWFLTLPRRKFETATEAATILIFFSLFLWVFLIGLWLLWVVGTLLTLTISRHREFVADRSAALLTGAPEMLSSALLHISNSIHQIPARDLREVAGMNALLIIPVQEPTDRWSLNPNVIFPTHPPLEQRLERLAETARRLGRRVDRSPRHQPWSTAVRARRRNVGAKIVVATGLTITTLSWLPASPAIGHRGWTYPLLGASAPALLIGFRAIGRALAGAPGLAYATSGVALCLVLPFSFLLGFVSYLFASALNWN